MRRSAVRLRLAPPLISPHGTSPPNVELDKIDEWPFRWDFSGFVFDVPLGVGGGDGPDEP